MAMYHVLSIIVQTPPIFSEKTNGIFFEILIKKRREVHFIAMKI